MGRIIPASISIVYTALAGLLNICSNLGTLAKHLADHCGQDDEWYHDNAKYKAVFQNRLREAVDAGTPILDINSFLSRILSPAICNFLLKLEDTLKRFSRIVELFNVES